MPKFKKPYDAPVRKQFTSQGPTMTQQHFKRECDINHIMAKYQKTGLIDHVAKHGGDYSDLTDVPTYHDAMNKIIAANESFSSLTSSIRSQFKNDPALFLDFVSNPENEQKMRELGLLPPAPPSQPDVPPVEDIPPSAPVE